MVNFEFDKNLNRWDVRLPYEMGDIKELVRVAYISSGKDRSTGGDKIFFTKELTISMVRQVLMHWDEHKQFMDRPPFDDVDHSNELYDLDSKEIEMFPDGEDPSFSWRNDK
tara:strand:+ start:291 stop:623 length:333 start_codon:yes stop_codon:yes gene_type:complete